MFVKKGYCRYCGLKCGHLKLKESIGICKKTGNFFTLPTSYGESISKKIGISIEAPYDCPKMKH